MHSLASLPSQAGHMKMGSWQMVLWQPRWLFADLEAVMYQKINKEGVRARAELWARCLGRRGQIYDVS